MAVKHRCAERPELNTDVKQEWDREKKKKNQSLQRFGFQQIVWVMKPFFKSSDQTASGDTSHFWDFLEDNQSWCFCGHFFVI